MNYERAPEERKRDGENLIRMAFFEELGLSRIIEDYRGSSGISWDHRGLFGISWGDMEQAGMNYERRRGIAHFQLPIADFAEGKAWRDPASLAASGVALSYAGQDAGRDAGQGNSPCLRTDGWPGTDSPHLFPCSC